MDEPHKHQCINEKELEELRERFKADGLMLILIRNDSNEIDVGGCMTNVNPLKLSKVLTVLAVEMLNKAKTAAEDKTNQSGKFN